MSHSALSSATTRFPLMKELLRAVDFEIFQRDFWDRQPLHVQDVDRRRFQHLMDMASLDRLISQQENCRDLLLVNHDPNAVKIDLPPLQKPNAQLMFDCFSRGYSVVVNALEHKWSPVQEFSRQLSHETGFENYINMYVTPPKGTAFRPHWDCEDVLILQVEGEKTWSLFGKTQNLPYMRDKYQARAQVLADAGEPRQTLVLKAGDVLYLPRGWSHQASATEQASMHLTVALRTPVWADVLREQVYQRAQRELALRRAVPLGWHRQEVDVFMADIPAFDWETDVSEVGDVQQEMKKRFIKETHSPQDGLFARVHAVNELTLATWLEKRHDQLFILENLAGEMCLTYPGFDCHGPMKLGWALETVLQEPRFQAAGLPAFLSDEERLTFCRHLLRRGFLRLAASQVGHS